MVGPSEVIMSAVPGRLASRHVLRGISGSGEPYYQMRSLTYHETIPGHHFQIELAREMNLPTFRNTIGITGYVEGWAL